MRKLPLSTQALDDTDDGPIVPGGVLGLRTRMSARPSTTVLGTSTTICVSLAVSGVTSISLPPWRKVTTVPGPVPKSAPLIVICPLVGLRVGVPEIVGTAGPATGGVGIVTRMRRSPAPGAMGMFICSGVLAQLDHSEMLATCSAIGKVTVAR